MSRKYKDGRDIWESSAYDPCFLLCDEVNLTTLLTALVEYVRERTGPICRCYVVAVVYLPTLSMSQCGRRCWVNNKL